MAIEVVIVSGNGNGVIAGVSNEGELLMRGFAHSDPTPKKLTDTTVVNFLAPTKGEQLILTGMYASADRSIAAAGDVLEIYESGAADSGIQDKLLFSVDLARQGDAGPNFPTTRITRGKFINADRTGSAGIITVTLWSYTVPVVT